MTSAQEKFYWRLWSSIRKAVPNADRHAIHKELGLPESHTAWRNEHFDKWIAHSKALSQPGNFRAQVQQIKMPEIRARVFIDHLLCALGKDEQYAEGIVARMNRHGRQGGPFLTLETMSEDALKDLMIALKKECRRYWKTKEHLLGEIYALCAREYFDSESAGKAILQGLGWKSLPKLEKLYYEPLLVVLSVLRTLGSGTPVTAATKAEDPDWTV